MLDMIFISLVDLIAPHKPAAPAHPAITLSSTGSVPDQGSAFRFSSEGPEQAIADQTGASLVRPHVETELKAKGFQLAQQKPRYLVEIAVTARPLNVGAYQGPAGANPAWLDKPAANASGVSDHVCEVRLRFVDAKTGAEAYRVSAQAHAPAATCATDNVRLVDAALAGIPLKKYAARRPGRPASSSG